MRTPRGGSGSAAVGRPVALRFAGRRGRGEQGVLAGRSGVASAGVRRTVSAAPPARARVGVGAVPVGRLLVDRHPVQRPLAQRVGPVGH